MMSDKNTISRRSFLKLGAGTLALGVVPQALASSTINIGIIGLGKQGMRLLSQLLALSNVRITALCDVAQPALAAAETVARTAGHTPRVTQDYRALLAGDDHQAVIIATPDFSHMVLTLFALEMRRDVYLETPLVKTSQQWNVLQSHARREKCILYAGRTLNTRSRDAVAAELVRAGQLGRISRIQIVVNTPSRETVTDLTEAQVAWREFLVQLAPRPFEASFLARWQEYQQCSDGAALAQLSRSLRAVHRVMRAHHPTRVTAHGGVYVWTDGRDNPDTFYALLDYAEGFVVQFAMYPGHSTSDLFTIHGTRGTLDLLHGHISTTDAIETPVPGTIVQHANEQLARATQSDTTLDDLAGWLMAVRQRVVPEDLTEPFTQEIMIAQGVKEAYRTGHTIRFGELSDHS